VKNFTEYVGKHKMKPPSIPPRRVEEQSEEAPSNSPKGGESKAVGSEE